MALGKIQGWKGLDEIVDERADEKGAVNSSKGKQEALHGDYPMDFYSVSLNFSPPCYVHPSMRR